MKGLGLVVDQVITTETITIRGTNDDNVEPGNEVNANDSDVSSVRSADPLDM